MKSTNFLNACSMALALIVVAPALAQEQDQEQELLNQEQELLNQKEAENRAADRAKRAELLDAIPSAVPFGVRQVAVECDGECTDSQLGTICPSGFIPIAVDCQNVQEWPPGVQCGDAGDNRCARFSVSTSDRLSDYCDDIDGWDANVYCAQ